MLGLLACSRAYVLACLACLSACVLKCLVCLRAGMLVMMKCFIFLRVCVLGLYTLGVIFCLISFTFQYINLKTCSEKFVCFVKLNIFLIYKTIKLIKLFETNLREAEKSIDISYSCSCSKAISIFDNFYIHPLH